MPREKDFAWAYCEKVPGSTKILCKFCREQYSGGIFRFKFHIAKIAGHDIGPCKGVPEDVRRRASLAIDCMNEMKMKKARTNVEMGNIAGGHTSSNTPLSPPLVESSIPSPSFQIPNPNMGQGQFQMPPPPPIPTNLRSGGGYIHTFFLPLHNHVPNLTWMARVGKRMSTSKQERPLLTFGTILTFLSIVPKPIIGNL